MERRALNNATTSESVREAMAGGCSSSTSLTKGLKETTAGGYERYTQNSLDEANVGVRRGDIKLLHDQDGERCRKELNEDDLP